MSHDIYWPICSFWPLLTTQWSLLVGLLGHFMIIFKLSTKFPFKWYVTWHISTNFHFLTTPDHSLVITGRSRRLETITIEFVASIHLYLLSDLCMHSVWVTNAYNGQCNMAISQLQGRFRIRKRWYFEKRFLRAYSTVLRVPETRMGKKKFFLKLLLDGPLH